MRAHVKAQHKRRGIAVVEFAMVAPVLIFLFLGMIELARIVQVKNLLNDAVRHAGRLAIQPDATDTSVTQSAKDILTYNSISTTNVTVTTLVNGSDVDVKTASGWEKISVKVSIPPADVGWVTSLFLPENSLASETLVLMKQR